MKKAEKVKKPFYKRWWFILFVGLTIFGMLGNLLESDESKQERLNEQAAQEQVKQDKKEQRDIKKKEREAKAKKDVENAKKELDAEKERKANLTFDQKIVEDNKDVDAASFENGVLTLKHNTKSMFSETSLLEFQVYDLFEIAGKSFKNPEVNQTNVIITAEMIDNKGNKEIEEIVKFNYSRASFEELNFKNFLDLAYSQSWRIFNESDSYWIHPGIYKNVKPAYKENLANGLAKN